MKARTIRRRCLLLICAVFVMANAGLLSLDGRCVAQDYGDQQPEGPYDFEEAYADDFHGSDFEDLPPAMQAVIMIIALLFMAAMLGIAIFILYLLYSLLNALPPQYRLMEPGMVFLLLIPCFNVIWNFFVYARISRSYQHYFFSHGRPDVGDCGASLGVAYSVCGVLVSIPCVNYFTSIFCGPVMLVLIILYLVKLNGLKQQIKSGKMAVAPQGENPFAI